MQVSNWETVRGTLSPGGGLPVEVDVHDAGQQFHEQDNADYSERIGDTVGNGCQRRVGAVNGNGKSRRTGKRSGYESHHARRVDVEGIFRSVAVGRRSR